LLVAPFPIRRRAAKRLVSNLPYVDGGRLLDVGCGNGSLLRTMRWAGWHVEGVEPDTCAAASARAAGLTVHNEPLEQTSLPSASFDAIIMHHVLEHMPTPLETLRHCRRLLRPGGSLWAVTPNLASAGYRTYSVDWVGLEVPRHLVLWNPHSLEQALQSADFDVVVLEPLAAGSMLRESAKLQARRLSPGLSRARALRITLEGALRDLRALRDPTLGEELVVLARARER
jgi:SAM-dependent methyltransferase